MRHHRFAILIATVLSLGVSLHAQTAAPTTAPTSAPGRGRGRGPAGPPPSATEPVIQRGTNARHDSFLEIAKKGDIDVLFLGDSITDFWRREGRGATVWQSTFAPLKAANFGINADRTQNVLWRVQNGELEGFKAKVIVMMLGTNNLSVPTNVRNTNEETLAGLKLVIKEIRDRQPQAKLLLLGIFPRGATPADPYRAQIKIVNTEIAKWADNKSIYYIDFGDKFLTADGTLTPEIMPDALHPSEKGYQIWADAIMPKVKELLAMP